jgi:glycosyltransferase involved in cell wall biosynthesis
MRSMRIAVVLTNSENVWFGGMAARLAGIPHLQVFHALTLEHHWGDHRALVRMYLGMLLSWNRCLVAVSRAVAAMLERNGVSSGRIAVIPNGFDIAGTVEASKRPLPANLAARLRGRHPVIVSLGRISAIKGQDLLVEALPTIVRKYPQMICLFGGELGSNEGVDNTHSFDDRLRERVAALGLENQVEFLGPVDFAPSLVRCADVYVQPSRSESFSRAVAEAAIIGAPVAAFAIGGIPEVVDSCLAEPENPAALASAILEQLQSRGQSEDAILRNRANVVDRYDAKKLVSDFREVLECATCRQPLASRWSRND